METSNAAFALDIMHPVAEVSATDALAKVFADHPELEKAFAVVHADEDMTAGFNLACQIIPRIVAMQAAMRKRNLN